MNTLSFLENVKIYVGFDEASSAALREAHAIVAPHFGPIIDDFYATIEAHPGARAAITGGAAQIQRLKGTLLRGSTRSSWARTTRRTSSAARASAACTSRSTCRRSTC